MFYIKPYSFFLQRYLIIYINNYFTSMLLFIELQAYNFNVINIIRLYKEFLNELIKIKIKYSFNNNNIRRDLFNLIR